jgi:hypothetical protein
MRNPRWPLSGIVLAVAAILLLPAAQPAFAQQKPASIAAPGTPPTDDELIDTRQQLLALLKMSPTLIQVVESDPTLLADQDYVARTNPQLAQFLVQHPEVVRNPDFYLFANLPGPRLRRRTGDGYDSPSDQDMRRQFMGDVMGTLAFVGIAGSFLWLVRLFLENRRWSRLFRLQSEVHNKLIDRFANNQEILHYMETEPGKRFLEAAPIPIAFERDQRTPAGLTRILGPLQIGIVLTLLGIGLLSLQHRLPDAADPMLIFGMVTLMPGLGFIISALITWRMSVHLGLMPHGPQPSTELTDRQ